VPAPLVAHFGPWTLDEPRAGALGRAHVAVENAGAASWGEDIVASYHWLDERGNAIVWDGLRTPLPEPVEPAVRVALELGVRAPMPPGRYRFALDLVAEHRAWFGELGNEVPEAEVQVLPRIEATRLAEVADVYVPDGCAAAPDWEERVLSAHAEGYAIVAGSIEAPRRLRKTLATWSPGAGRAPAFAEPLLCPSILKGVAAERLPDVEGLPAFAPPLDEPWVYDGAIVLTLRR
jgi:hypothetical protein